jgi:hypothetical protein
MAEGTKLPPVPVGVQRLLRLAAASEPFLAELERDAEAAAGAAGVALTTSERAILRAISTEQLRQMVAVVPEPDVGLAYEFETQAREAVEVVAERRHREAESRWIERPPEREESITDLGIIVGDRPARTPFTGTTPVLRSVESTLGIRPDVPPRPIDIPPSQGIRPEVPPERPDRVEVSRGIGARLLPSTQQGSTLWGIVKLLLLLLALAAGGWFVWASFVDR